MGRGRPKKKDKLTRAEISRNYRQKKKLKDPDGVKKSVATSNKKQYEKNKHNLNYMMKKRKDSVLKYYNKKAKTIPQLQVMSASKEKGSSWGVGVFFDGLMNTICPDPDPKHKCRFEQLHGTYEILWMFTSDDMTNCNRNASNVKFKQLLNTYDDVTLILYASIPQNVHIGNTKWTMNRSTVEENWNVGTAYVGKKMLLSLEDDNREQGWQKNLPDNLQWPLTVVSMMGSNGKWVFPSNGTAVEYNECLKILYHDTSIYVTVENEDDSKVARIDRSENANSKETLKAFQNKTEYVPVTGSDKENVKDMYRTLRVHAFCFHLKAEVLRGKNQLFEALEIIKNKDTVTQVRMKFLSWKEHAELTVDINNVLFTQFMGRMKKGNKVTSSRISVQTDFYNPCKEAERTEYYKKMLKKCDTENQRTRARVVSAIKNLVNETRRMNKTYREMFCELKSLAVDEKVSTIDSNIWNGVSEPVEMFIIFMKSPFPVAYVDMTYEFLLNMIPTGIYNDFKASPKTIPCTYSPCRTLGENIVRIVSLKKISIYCKFVF